MACLHQLEERTYTAPGHIRLDKLTSRHIQSFINNLGEEGISTRSAGARVKGLPHDISQKELARRAGVGPSTVSSAYRGERVSLETAEKLAQVLGQDMKKLFTVEAVKGNLSAKTIRNCHSFVSSVLGYAVKMGMLRDNPARNVILPPMEHSEKECYTLEEAQARAGEAVAAALERSITKTGRNFANRPDEESTVRAALLNWPMFLPPGTHLVKDGDEGLSSLRQTIFHLRRDLRIFLPMDQTIGLQLFQRRAERFIGNAANIFFHLVEADNAIAHQSIEDKHFIFPLNDGHCVAESGFFQAGVFDTFQAHTTIHSP